MSRRNSDRRSIKCAEHEGSESIQNWKRLFKSDAPTRMREQFRRVLIQHAQQERAIGSAYRAIDRQLASLQRDSSTDSATQITSAVRFGTRLIRGWGGVNHEVMVLEKGFSYRGNAYRSLSEIARLITGVRWSGPRFFGIWQPEKST
jgi:hypothetical protein